MVVIILQYMNVSNQHIAHLIQCCQLYLNKTGGIKKIYSLSNFQVYNTVLLTIVTILYITCPECIPLTTVICTL